ncbi:MAG: diacylglycerol kinase family lipid kinase [Actinomycetia bacterium]|nr:diacylglycerol kinase family lipid kinase [Actinomycetes bacterium]
MEQVRNITVLVNPASSNGTGHEIWLRLLPHFEKQFTGRKIRIIETTSADHAEALGATLDTQMIVSVSGDGALRDIAQGLMGRPSYGRPALTVIPVGSGNDFARNLGLPTNPWLAITRLARGRRQVIDVGKVNSQYFLNTVSFGVDAAIAHRTTELRRSTRRRGFVLYGQAALSAVVKDLRPHRCLITIDGHAEERDLLICAAQNGRFYGGGFRIAPTAELDDGLLNICMVTQISKPKAVYYLARIAQGTHEMLPSITTVKTNALSVSVDADVPAQCDGEQVVGVEVETAAAAQLLRYDLQLIPAALDVIGPGE